MRQSLVFAVSMLLCLVVFPAWADPPLRVIVHKTPVKAVGWSPDGKLLATVSADRTVKFWEPNTGRLVSRLSGFRGPVQAVAFHPGGKIAATADWSGAVRIWDLTSPSRPREIAALRRIVGPESRFRTTANHRPRA